MSAEYIMSQGNEQVILCERGILPLGKGKSYTRYTLDLAAVPVMQKETYLPVIVDPSHAAGRNRKMKTYELNSMARLVRDRTRLRRAAGRRQPRVFDNVGRAHGQFRRQLSKNFRT